LIKRFDLKQIKESDRIIQPNHGLTVDLVGEKEVLRNPVDETMYRIMIGSLAYLMISTRKDISYAVEVLPRFTSKILEKTFEIRKNNYLI